MFDIVGDRLHEYQTRLELSHQEAVRTIDALESGWEELLEPGFDVEYPTAWNIRQRITLRHNLLSQWFRGENLDICLVLIDSTHTMDERCFCHVMEYVTEYETTEGQLSALGDLLSRSVTAFRRISLQRVDLLSEMFGDVIIQEYNRSGTFPEMS
jgi:hypothetical protein